MGLKLSLYYNGCSDPLCPTFGETTDVTPTLELSDTKKYTLTLVDIRFNKQMYQPGEINARIQFSPVISLADLQSTFLKCKVELLCGGDTIAGNYYVHELQPQISKSVMVKGKSFTFMYVDFKIFSPDKMLTMTRESIAYTAKRLAQDILKTETKKVSLPYCSSVDLSTLLDIHPRNDLYFRTVYKKDSAGKYVLEDGKKVVSHYEDYIQPYMVQYDESFYDLLIRTANRWGEFVYFEDGKLVLGRSVRDSETATNPTTFEVGYSMVNTPSNAENYRDIVSNDEYLEYILQDDYIKQVGDLFAPWPDDRHAHHVVQSFVTMPSNVFDWATNKAVSDLFTAGQNKHYLDELRDRYNNTYFFDPVYSDHTDEDTSKWTKRTGEAAERVDLQYGDVCLKLDEDIIEAQKKVDKLVAKDHKTYEDYVDEDYKVDTNPSGASDDLKKALKKLETAYSDLKALHDAQKAVNKAAPAGSTYLDYVDAAGTVTTPANASDDLKTALTNLQTALSDTKAKKKLHAYAQFAILGELDEEDQNTSALSQKVYKNVLKQEAEAGKVTVCVDLDANYQHLLLGDVFKIGSTKYLVTRVECVVDDTEELSPTTAEKTIGGVSIEYISSVELTHTKSLHFRVYGIKQVEDKIFYPPMLPTGHARISSPQLAIIKDTFDPKMNARYRIQYPWQLGGDSSPWLSVTHEMLSQGCGSVWHLEEESVVMLDYKDGNIERPYIIGALQTNDNKAARSTQFNNMDLTTPAGHAIRMTDGYGAGAAAFSANFIPIVSVIKNFWPEGSAWHNESGSWHDYKYYEGGVELTDRYGIYSIKASTDERNISIRSPYGDVNLNAFTGITISAPNGDVRIVGKNVSIEAGNKLTLESGKNVENAILGKWGQAGTMKVTGPGLGETLTKAVINKVVSYIDLSILRHLWEVILRPVDGTLEIKSNRYLLLEAGKGEATIQRDRYRKDKLTTPSPDKLLDKINWNAFVGLAGVIDLINTHVDEVYNTMQTLWRTMGSAKALYLQARTALNNDGKLNDEFKSGAGHDEHCVKVANDVHTDGTHAAKTYQHADLFNTPGPAADQATLDLETALLTAASTYSTAASKLFLYVKNHAVDTTQATFFYKNALTDVILSDPKTTYYDKVQANVNEAQKREGATLIATADFNYGADGNATASDANYFKKGRKTAKRAWFYAVMQAIDDLPYMRLTSPALTYNGTGDDSWKNYVNDFTDNADTSRPWGKICGNPFANIGLQFAAPIADRMRWESGKSGKIILSDEPVSSITFGMDGTPKMYMNRMTDKRKSGLSLLKNLLHDWD